MHGVNKGGVNQGAPLLIGVLKHRLTRWQLQQVQPLAGRVHQPLCPQLISHQQQPYFLHCPLLVYWVQLF
jgi:hypothetical protein